jgi:hypothetical protein
VSDLLLQRVSEPRATRRTAARGVPPTQGLPMIRTILAASLILAAMSTEAPAAERDMTCRGKFGFQHGTTPMIFGDDRTCHFTEPSQVELVNATCGTEQLCVVRARVVPRDTPKDLLPIYAIVKVYDANTEREKWEGVFRQCHIRKWFSKDELAEIGWQRNTPGQTIVIEENEIGDLEKAIQVIKKCRAFYKCLEDREAGKVKHCYENDRRWR